MMVTPGVPHRRWALAGPIVPVALVVGVGAMLLLRPVAAQQPDPSRLTLERVFASTEFRSQEFGPARWIGVGAGTSLHVFSLLERYLHDHVPAGAH